MFPLSKWVLVINLRLIVITFEFELSCQYSSFSHLSATTADAYPEMSLVYNDFVVAEE
jgi:hypothetical protein